MSGAADRRSADSGSGWASRRAATFRSRSEGRDGSGWHLPDEGFSTRNRKVGEPASVRFATPGTPGGVRGERPSSSLRVASGSPRTCCRNTCCNLVPRSSRSGSGVRPASCSLVRAPGRSWRARGLPPDSAIRRSCTSEVSSPTWACILQRETSRLICLILARKLISIICQPVLLAATRCYLIQMLRCSLTCTNGCSCWSADEENSPGVFLSMDALYRLS
jgi:hypothetical protein